MNISASKLLVAVAFVCFLIAFILTVAGGDLGFEAHGWGYLGLGSWALAALL